MTEPWQRIQLRAYVEAAMKTREQQRRDEYRRRSGVGPFQLRPEVFAYRAHREPPVHPETARRIAAERIGEVFRAAGYAVTQTSAPESPAAE